MDVLDRPVGMNWEEPNCVVHIGKCHKPGALYGYSLTMYQPVRNWSGVWKKAKVTGTVTVDVLSSVETVEWVLLDSGDTSDNAALLASVGNPVNWSVVYNQDYDTYAKLEYLDRDDEIIKIDNPIVYKSEITTYLLQRNKRE